DICATLNKYCLIKPWPITVKIDSSAQVIEGLSCIDEQALNALSNQDFETIRREGALPLAYCQLISMQHLSTLAQLAESQAGTTKNSDELNFEFLNQSDTISFTNLG